MPFWWIRWKLRTRRVEFSTPLTRPTALKTHLISNDRSSMFILHPWALWLLPNIYLGWTQPKLLTLDWSGWGNKAQIIFEFTNLENFGDQWGQEPNIQDPNGDILHTKNPKTTVLFYQPRLVGFWNNHIDHTYIGQISWMLLALQFQCAGWLLKLNDTIWGWYCSGYKSGETKTNGAVVFHVHLIFSFSVCGIPGISVSLSSFQGEE